MRRHHFQAVLALGIFSLLGAACGSGGSLTLAPGAAGAKLGPTFGGVGTASPLSPSEVVVSWPFAFSDEFTPGQIRYRVYRAFDPNTVLLETAFLAETGPGVTTYVDLGLPPYTTVYYRVVAIDPSGNGSLSAKVTSAFPPTEFMAGQIDYDTNVAPIWNLTPLIGAAQSCLDCHSFGGGATTSLESWLDVVVGSGTEQSPDSFVVPFDGEATWLEFVARISATPLPHLDFLVDPSTLLSMRPILEAWANEGALSEPDQTPPFFEFDDINNAGKYNVFFETFDTATVEWFDGSDPESLPLNGDNTGQLEYAIYAGTDPATIDWLNPVVNEIYSPTKTIQFPWTENRIAVVVRALDASGRSNAWSVDPIISRARRANESLNARVAVASRETP